MDGRLRKKTRSKKAATTTQEDGTSRSKRKKTIGGDDARRKTVLVGVYRDMKEKLDEWDYPIHEEMNFAKPQGDFETRIALIIAFSTILIGIII